MVEIANLPFNGKKIYIQSMLNIPSEDIENNVKQAIELEKAGCEILRVAIPDKSALALIPAIKSAISIPLVADIHYDYKLALGAVEMGIDKIRINPGNIGDKDRVKAVAQSCNQKNIPIRIGVNKGSANKGLVESAAEHIKLLEENDFHNIVVSIKSSTVTETIKANREFRERCNYPLHIGITEAGTERMGIIKSAVGIGSLLVDGIGETIRVSLTGNPVKEIQAAKDILKAIGKYNGVQIISCPTCGRTKIDVETIANELEKAIEGKNLPPIKLAVMGCAVNGIGESKDADLGIAGGNKEAVIFRKGELLRKIPENRIIEEFLTEIDNFVAEMA
ncbi:MAG: flavodoxin-dependent (E)-4-hydroxy-3-methylbut-2-enyl-diphosphate synthase [Oscillospiraceae bacterium]|jgi:(E)-4-hydroxy-3-methylbut-2-enyl-diphosphate synthase|nr:flavodoxin-dependent (E)-4-hydroxy-3-methylbut-2-enyl-diphosphate synthase [Oscillospiraceae bacterium]